jgi:hypothetical protein
LVAYGRVAAEKSLSSGRGAINTSREWSTAADLVTNSLFDVLTKFLHMDSPKRCHSRPRASLPLIKWSGELNRADVIEAQTDGISRRLYDHVVSGAGPQPAGF